MRIQNNIPAMNTHRVMGINNTNMSKSLEKLSSGYRINRAGDDAAGLAISEKMRAQIRGLTMASKNSSDAISLVQTAEGALQSTHDILQRMRELAVQASSDTNEQVIDRGALDQEFQALKKEIDDIADKTVFNDQKLIDGTFSEYKLGLGGATSLKGPGMTVGVGNAAEGLYTFEIIKQTVTPSVTSLAPTLDDSAINLSSIKNGNLTVAGTTMTIISAQKSALLNGNYSLEVLDASDPTAIKFRATGDNGEVFETTYNAVAADLTAGGAGLVTITFTGNFSLTLGVVSTANIGGAPTSVPSEAQLDAFKDMFNGIEFTIGGGVNERKAEFSFFARLTGGGPDIKLESGMSQVSFDNGITVKFDALATAKLDTTKTTAAAGGPADVFGATASTIQVVANKNKSMIIQTGANQGDEMSINIDRMDATYLNIIGAKVDTRESASRAITQVNNAINAVSTQRAALGALQNRLEFKIANLDTSAENLQSAESRIRDVDMAKEMMNFTKNNILSQAATAMMAQANSLPQNVLQLLR